MANVFLYVSTTGNDANNGLSTGASLLTLAAAFGKCTDTVNNSYYILMADGSYAGNDSALGYHLFNTAFSTRVTVGALSGMPDKVFLTGAGGSALYSAVFANASNLHFDQINFTPQSTTVTTTVRWTGNATSNIRFTRCKFYAQSIATSNYQCMATAWTTANSTISGLTWDDCDFLQIGPYSTGGMLLDNAGSGSVASDIRMINCRFMNGYYCARLLGITNLTVAWCRMRSFSPITTAHALQIGVDGPTGATCSGRVVGCHLSSLNGHTLVLGAGCNGVEATGNYIYGGESAGSGHALVVKQALYTKIHANHVFGGKISTFYFKAAAYCSAYGNYMYGHVSGSIVLRIEYNPESGDKCHDLTIRGNYIRASAGTVLSIPTSSGESGNLVIDGNTYAATGSATLGSVRGATVTTLPEIRAAWSGYATLGNDDNSSIGELETIPVGIGLVRIP